VYRPVSACGLIRVGGERTRPVREWEELKHRPTLFARRSAGHSGETLQLHPLVAPQVLHFMQVPLRTSV
jgi:hypothetical protein